MADLSFLNDFAVGGKTQSNSKTSSSKASASEKKSISDNNAVKNFISNFRKMAAVAKDMQASGQQPVSSEPVSNTASSRGLAPGTLENTQYTGQERGGIADPTSPYPQQDNTAGGKNLFKESMNAVKNKASEYQKAEETKKAAEAENPDDYVEYTYKPGDTFGQVILDLGIDTDKGLWGRGGDVEFYTKQLREQGIPGMVPIGTKIRLKKRK